MIKRLFYILIAVFLAFNVWATDPFFDEIFSGGEGVSCSVSNDSEQWAPDTQDDTNYAQSAWLAQRFTIAAQITVTGYLIDVDDQGDNDELVTVSIFNGDATDPTEPEDAVANSSITVDTDLLPDALTTDYFYELASPIVLPAGTYWVVQQEVGAAALFTNWDSTSTGDRKCYSINSGANWTCEDNQAYDMEIWGCGP